MFLEQEKKQYIRGSRNGLIFHSHSFSFEWKKRSKTEKSRKVKKFIHVNEETIPLNLIQLQTISMSSSTLYLNTNFILLLSEKSCFSSEWLHIRWREVELAYSTNKTIDMVGIPNEIRNSFKTEAFL